MKDLQEPLRSSASLALSLYFGAWLGFAAYLALGMHASTFYLATLALLGLNIAYGRTWMLKKRTAPPRPHWSFMAFVILFTIPFILGLSFGKDGELSFNFNFIDTSIHMAVARAFLENPHFPPKDLVMAGYPLKYHFMADFFAAFLSIGSLGLLKTIYALNIAQAIITAMVLWGIVDSLSERQRPLVTTTVCAGFAFIMPLCSNLLHDILFHPDYFPAGALWRRLVFPYFNFEYIMEFLLQPQRALLFSLPIILLIIHAIAKLWRDYETNLMRETAWLLALMPFSHATSFLVLSAYLTIILVKHHRLWPKDMAHFLLPGVIALAQVLYTLYYGPAFTPGYSGWDVSTRIPLQEFQSLPALLRRPMFWILVNGEFFALGGIGLFLAWRAFHRQETKSLLKEPIPYFLGISFLFFLFINFYRYSRNWGDSNKFVFFLNFWLIVIFGQQLNALLSKKSLSGNILLILTLAFSLCPFIGDLYSPIYQGTLFSKTDVLAAKWIRQNTHPDDIFIITPLDSIHFVPALSGRAVLQGPYASGAPCYDPLLEQGIRMLYENGNFEVLKEHAAQYLIVSARERTQYSIHPIFDKPKGLVHAVQLPDSQEVRIYDARALAAGYFEDKR